MKKYGNHALFRSRQRGVLLVAGAALLGLTVALAVAFWLASRLGAEQDRVLAARLAEAHAALIGYAWANGCKLPIPSPLAPDDGSGQTKARGTAYGEEEILPNKTGLWVGPLPWRTLGLAGEANFSETQPLWYVVYCPNADCKQNDNRLTLYRSSDGRALEGGAQNAVFAVLAAGPALGNQNRSGGAVRVSDYLEGKLPVGYPTFQLNTTLTPYATSPTAFQPVLTPPSLWRVASGSYNDAGTYATWSDLSGCASSGGSGSSSSGSSPPQIDLDGSGPNGTPVRDAFRVAGQGGVVSPADPDANGKAALVSDAAPGGNGACFWFDPMLLGYSYPNGLPFAGKTWRGFLRFRLARADPPGGFDRGYGFAVVVAGGKSADLLNFCGDQSDLGLPPGYDTGSHVRQVLHFLEFDVHYSSNEADPNGNHLAWKIGFGNRPQRHDAANGGVPIGPCAAGNAGCVPAIDRWEESPQPLADNVRFEIAAKCNANCSDCSGASGTAFVRVRAWLNCADQGCDGQLDRDWGATPTVEACQPRLQQSGSGFPFDHAFFGITAGWLGNSRNDSNGQAQSATFWGLRLVWEE